MRLTTWETDDVHHHYHLNYMHMRQPWNMWINTKKDAPGGPLFIPSSHPSICPFIHHPSNFMKQNAGLTSSRKAREACPLTFPHQSFKTGHSSTIISPFNHSLPQIISSFRVSRHCSPYRPLSLDTHTVYVRVHSVREITDQTGRRRREICT
jgi:hypothetical protein